MISHPKIIQKTRDALTLSAHKLTTTHEEKIRLKHFIIFFLCGLPILICFGIFNFIQGQTGLATLLFVNSFVFFFSWYKLFESPNPTNIYRLCAGMYALLLCYNFISGGLVDGRSLWLYTFPLIAFFLLGVREGLVWAVVVPLLSILFFFSPLTQVGNQLFSLDYLLRFFIVYTMLTGITCWFEHFRSSYHKKLIIEHNRFQDILMYSRDILYRRDLRSGKYQYVSEAFAQHLGYNTEDFQEISFEDIAALVHPEDQKFYKSNSEKLITNPPKNRQISMEYRMRHKSGEYLWFRDQITILYNDRNEPETVIGANREVTEVLMVERALRDAKTQLLTILDAIDAHIHVADMETYRILFINNKMQNDFADDLTGKICWKEFRKASGPCEDCSNRLLLDKNNKSTGVHTWEGYNTITNRWYLNHDRAIQWIDGRWVRIQIAMDITREKYLEEERKQNEEIINRSSQLNAIGTLAGGIAHDFNNLLQIIDGNIALIEKNDQQQERNNVYIQEIKKASEKAQDVVSRMLKISSAAPKYRLPLPIAPFLTQLSDEAVAGKSISNKMNIQAGLWQVLMDYNQITTALKNIFENACDSITGDGTITITAENYQHQSPQQSYRSGLLSENDPLQPGKYVKISIKDTGKGITAKDRKKVFEPYFTTKPRGAAKGLGLGLAITHAIITQHSGTIKIESEENKGTEVIFFLPASDENIEYRTP